MRKVLETRLFLALGSFGTLGPKLSHGTSAKFADVRTHLRKVFLKILSSIAETSVSAFLNTKQLSEEIGNTHGKESNDQVADHGLLGRGFP